MSEKIEWIEIVEPKTKQRMFANLVSGECAWEVPPNVPYKRKEDNQWWELYCSKTGRFYYYNPNTTETKWQKPNLQCDIIPLAKLQGDSLESFTSRKSEKTKSGFLNFKVSPNPSISSFNASAPSAGQSIDCISQVSSQPTANVPSNSFDLSTSTLPTSTTNAINSETWTKDALKNPLGNVSDKKCKKNALIIFKLLQYYMGDRKLKSVKSTPDNIALSIMEYVDNRAELIDEIFLQIIKQLNDNFKPDSIINPEVFDKILKFVESNSDPLLDSPGVSQSQYAKHCLKKLQFSQTPRNFSGPKPSIEAIRQARYNIFYPSKFGTSLDELMELQAEQFPHLKIPWIFHILLLMIVESGGHKTEGIFRVAPDNSEINKALVQLEIFVKPNVESPHCPAYLLKMFLRQLPVPLIPPTFYDTCLQAASNPKLCCQIIDSIPSSSANNKLVLATLIKFLQQLCENEEIVKITKMDSSNLAPNILRTNKDPDPAVILSNSSKEMEFMKSLITHYKTTDIHSYF